MIFFRILDFIHPVTQVVFFLLLVGLSEIFRTIGVSDFAIWITIFFLMVALYLLVKYSLKHVVEIDKLLEQKKFANAIKIAEKIPLKYMDVLTKLSLLLAYHETERYDDEFKMLRNLDHTFHLRSNVKRQLNNYRDTLKKTYES